MCGRFTQTKSRKEVLAQLGEIELPPLFHERYNVAPTQEVAVIQQNKPTCTKELTWGFENPHSGSLVINARSDTLTERPMFNDLLASNRCLIPADGFYEWKDKQPYYFQLSNNQLFAFAALWRNNHCVIITRAADRNMQGIHHRMPVILTQKYWKTWLDSFQFREPPILSAHPVSGRVNKVANDDPACLEPADEQDDLFLFPE